LSAKVQSGDVRFRPELGQHQRLEALHGVVEAVYLAVRLGQVVLVGGWRSANKTGEYLIKFLLKYLGFLVAL
jgi:hypothetical protein